METKKRKRRIQFAEFKLSPYPSTAKPYIETLNRVIQYTEKKRWFISQSQKEELNILREKSINALKRLNTL